MNQANKDTFVVMGAVLLIFSFAFFTFITALPFGSHRDGTIVAINNTWNSDGSTYYNVTVAYSTQGLSNNWLAGASIETTFFIYHCTYYHLGSSVPVFYYPPAKLWLVFPMLKAYIQTYSPVPGC